MLDMLFTTDSSSSSEEAVRALENDLSLLLDVVPSETLKLRFLKKVLYKLNPYLIRYKVRVSRCETKEQVSEKCIHIVNILNLSHISILCRLYSLIWPSLYNICNWFDLEERCFEAGSAQHGSEFERKRGKFFLCSFFCSLYSYEKYVH